MIKTALITTILVMFSSFANAEIIVIVNPANQNALDAKSVQRIFLGKEKNFADGTEAKGVNLEAGNQVRQEFDQSVLGRSTSQIKAYWSKLVFTGKGIPPEEVSTDAAVIEFVKSNPNAIGYVNSSSVTDDVKTITL